MQQASDTTPKKNDTTSANTSNENADEQWKRDARTVLYFLVAALAFGLVYSLSGAFAAPINHDQLTLIDNTTQYLNQSDPTAWVDITFDNTLTTSAFWVHNFLGPPQSALVISAAEGTWDVRFAINPTTEAMSIARPSTYKCWPTFTPMTWTPALRLSACHTRWATRDSWGIW